MAKGDVDEAEAMTALISGFLAASAMYLAGVLTQPVTLVETDPNGMLKFRLASGMLVTVLITVEPVDSHG